MRGMMQVQRMESKYRRMKPPQAKPVDPCLPPIPFPQRLTKAKLEPQFKMFLEVLKKRTNVPFLNVILEMPSYAIFLKDVLSNKRRF